MRRHWRRILLGVALVAAAGAAVSWWRVHRMADLGAGFVAKQMCSCVFVGGRSFESCRADMPESMDRVRAELDDGGAGVRGSVPFFARRRALYAPGTGCTLH